MDLRTAVTKHASRVVAAQAPEGHRFEHQGPSPLDYSTSSYTQPERLALVKNDDDSEGHATEFAFGNHWVNKRTSPSGRRLKNPKRVDTPKAPPGTRAFVDYTTPSDSVLHVNYARTREDSEGQGHATALMHHLIDMHPDHTHVDWGKIMSNEMNSVRLKVEKAHPERTFSHKVWF